MALCERPGGKCWYYVYTYIDPETGKKKEKWKSTGIPCSRKSERARDEAKRIGERMRDEFLEEMRQKQAGKKIIHQKRESKSQSTLSEYARYWLSEIKGSVEDSTLHSYEGPLKKHILPRLGDIILLEIDQYDLKEFINAELQECDERQREIDRLKEEAGGDIRVKSDKRPYYQSIKKHLRILNTRLKKENTSQSRSPG